MIEHLIIGLFLIVAALWCAERCIAAWQRFEDWQHVQRERERRHALRVASGHGPRVLP